MRTGGKSAFIVPALAAVISLAGCGEEAGQGEPATDASEFPEERVVPGTDEDPETEREPTAQSGTGGEIPGYDPAEQGKAERQEEEE